MKILNRLFMFAVSVMLCLTMLVSCGDILNKAPMEVSTMHSSGESVAASSSYFKTKDSCKPAAKKDGYVSSLTLKADVIGYDADFTYFDCILNITWTYNLISDACPQGEEKTAVVGIELDASGNGSYLNKIELEGCRGVSVVKVDYQWCGSVTKL